ncbi:hypothetical protein COW36_11465 [bacterium (Candidatus Blackallbacteria) CG17_big_fil_post_rev_8_21_14_2_50_48_46]|uniref:Type II secretion system protein n=1 Tax=bacterium (Candidatus Blackallbacteria) CG17_big_fil_post_rev_8_21_14_2_50_48_46 TaxID=2014261 RepID=A0A2M7G4J8_9BACT|nr:MAG: hypothetical protein COW64_21685 [bacterium (Candidatus Blackallbacteria) CG18_big_fil_WC_8_21_14_2_50_49_26]PIW16756.1 MAG: hypothetical protein COW36_11465 [bacterium (Candidatus Blackallbacteria) CG17_big_fil_post_rev_8_21_14_2_50_48_46]PIW49548.1 MAG: hypothetical protein COW20_05385 [bacterium (Candidatus Blackallbacteria) CG13_big_fil_rev_8_21_14_2_50_49_14]
MVFLRKFKTKSQQRFQKGLTLVELMVVMGLMSIVIVAITKLMFSFTTKMNQQNLSMQVREELRNTLRGLEKELRNGSGVIASCSSSRCGGQTYNSGADVLVIAQPIYNPDATPKSLNPYGTGGNEMDFDVVVFEKITDNTKIPPVKNLVMSRFPGTGSAQVPLNKQVRYRGLSDINTGLHGKAGTSAYERFSYYNSNGNKITSALSCPAVPETPSKCPRVVEIQLCGLKTYGAHNLVECKMVDTRFLWQSYFSL